MNKRTLLIGASENTERYANMAIKSLRKHNHDVIAIGRKAGRVEDVTIETDKPLIKDVDTVTLYLNSENQKMYYDYILGLKPKRIIFNPGAENAELENLAKKNGIIVEEACTLVMLSIGAF